MKHLNKGYIFNGKPIPNTKMAAKGIDQRMTDAADGNSTRPRMILPRPDEGNED